MSALPFRVRWVGGIAVVGLGPRAAGESIPPGISLANFCSGGRGMVLDFGGIEFLSSEILGKIVIACHDVKMSGGRLRLCCPEGSAREVFTITRLDRMLPVFGTLSEALADFEIP